MKKEGKKTATKSLRSKPNANSPLTKATSKGDLLKETEASVLSLEQISQLIEETKSSPKFYNSIPKLLAQYTYIDSSNIEDITKARKLTKLLFKVFKKLLTEGRLSFTARETADKKQISSWLRARYEAFKIELLLSLQIVELHQETKYYKLDILDIVIKLIKLESSYCGPAGTEPYFATKLYRSLLLTLLQTGDEKNLLKDGTIDNYLILEFKEVLFQYQDLKYYFFHEIQQELNSTQLENKVLAFSNYLTLLYDQPIYEDFDNGEYLVEYVPKLAKTELHFKLAFEKCWLGLLNWNISFAQNQTVLGLVHKRLLPFMENQQQLMDFLTDTYDLGFENNHVNTCILSLNGLFELMKNYNLEYPDFFTKLYRILNPDLLHSPHKTRFFRMLDIFLTGDYLSSTMIASFIKKLARLSLTAPISGIVIVIPFIYNLLRRHPACMVLIHNPNPAENYQDLYDDNETNPDNTRAIESSVWELETLATHYHPNIASLAKIFSQPFHKYSYNLEDFLDWDCAKLLDGELSKKYKTEAGLEFEPVDRVFGAESEEAQLKAQREVYMSGWVW
ncbi:hypothetical protein LJB42_002529 [Komagataella kurtzmanii]|nr:hypothetical protein LJB42_002529 [Komagataella kurtzmanii]